jgi:hypothetical protein
MANGGELLIAATGLAAVLSLAFRYQRARTAERAQLKWLVYAAALVVAGALAGVPAEQIMGPGDASNNLQNVIVTRNRCPRTGGYRHRGAAVPAV